MIPRLATLDLQQIPSAFDDPEWIFEIRHDGFRALAQIDGGQCKLVSRNDNAFKRFETLRLALPDDLKEVVDVVLDGEIVALDATDIRRIALVGDGASNLCCARNGIEKARDQSSQASKRRPERMVDATSLVRRMSAGTGRVPLPSRYRGIATSW